MPDLPKWSTSIRAITSEITVKFRESNKNLRDVFGFSSLYCKAHLALSAKAHAAHSKPCSMQISVFDTRVAETP
jgi:hypothetical protein